MEWDDTNPVNMMLFQESPTSIQSNVYQANQLYRGTLIRDSIYKHANPNYKRKVEQPELIS